MSILAYCKIVYTSGIFLANNSAWFKAITLKFYTMFLTASENLGLKFQQNRTKGLAVKALRVLPNFASFFPRTRLNVMPSLFLQCLSMTYE